MAATKGGSPFSGTSVLEDVLKQNATRLSDIDLVSKMTEEASLRRYEAAEWLRKTVGVVGGKDLPAEPSEEEFRLGLRSGIILCNVLNKIQPGAVPKVVEGACDAVVATDGAALSAYQYFENVRNFLVAVEELGLPTFEASDLEKGGKSARIVNCVLALKAYDGCKQGGRNGSWKNCANAKPPTSVKHFVCKNSQLFMNSFCKTLSPDDIQNSLDGLSGEQFSCSDLGYDLNDMNTSHWLSILAHRVIMDRKQEEIPIVVESLLSKVVEEFEHRIACHDLQMNQSPKAIEESSPDEDQKKPSDAMPAVSMASARIAKEDCCNQSDIHDEVSNGQLLKWKLLLEKQLRDVMELKNSLLNTKSSIQFMQMKYEEDFCNLGKQLHGFANAASEYRIVLEENRKLYNQVQDLKGSIRVYCRVRPFLSENSNCLSTVDHMEEGNIVIATPSKTGKEGRRSFRFNKVFGPSAYQEEVFLDTQPLIRSVLDGYNVCIFAYGQTGSGKTYTMSGPRDLTEEKLGVNYRALSDLFNLSEQREGTISYDISVQMIEIYNEQVRDLLAADGANKRLEIRNSSQNGINVPDANLVPVSSTSDVIYLMNLGQNNRAVSATALNDRSSRSHSCLTVHVHGRDATSGSILHGCMHLVDLAGSERVDKSKVTGDRLKEAQHINKSLSALGDVIASLAQKNTHVPYRNSKLTQLLQDSLGGQAKTLMFVHISPEIDSLGETISTLKFAERVATVELGAARVNKDSAAIRELKEQIAILKAALARKEGEPGHLSHSWSSTPERLRSRSGGASPPHPDCLATGDPSSGRQLLIEEVSNLEMRNNSASMTKRQGFDLHDLSMHKTPWTPVGSPDLNFQMNASETKSGDWVDKVTSSNGKDDGPLLSERHLSDPSNGGDSRDCNLQSNRSESVSDDSSDVDATTSESLEMDVLFESNLSKSASMPNGFGSKTKKAHPKPAKSSETRSSIPVSGPSPPRKLPNRLNPPLHRAGRQPIAMDSTRRRASSGK